MYLLEIPVSKRIFDVVIACCLLIILSPILLILYILVLFFHGKPALFKQKRPGFKGKPFNILKFRTMTNARSSDGKMLSDEQRLTKFGSFLRKTSLDELPELFNIMKGEMSLVGPRPLLMQYLTRYTKEQSRRHDVMPGITGWAQVNGRNAISWEDKFQLDTWYVDHWNIFLDIKILFLTFWKVIKREGINQAGQATAEEFMGYSEKK
ncbi:MAG: sugar transferase [Chloroflexota bacterium]